MNNYEFLYKKATEKKENKNTVFILKYICCSLENVLYLFFLQAFTDIFKKHLSDGSIYLNLTGAIGFCISVLCCEILTLT